MAKIPEHVKSALLGELKQPDLAELVAYFFKAAGGVKAVATLLYEEFVAAKPGSLIRQRIMELVLRNARHVSERLSPDDMGMLSEADLDSEILRLIPNGQEEAET